MANKSNYFPRRSSHFKNYKVILSGRGSHMDGRINFAHFKDINGIIMEEEKEDLKKFNFFS
ncbi:hypothetical protein [Fusobacterium mortiferum]|uniref:Uncharacterized protein n=1 Tax=Fusobacterium mortiferum TaxID=850 RepID=A0ABS2G0S8_FUSMR|nr:hypothetical protein [Fusobacterium mortiferum]MBM6875004.1 hypothetical protein [Fusobacterium mortiferum]